MTKLAVDIMQLYMAVEPESLAEPRDAVLTTLIKHHEVDQPEEGADAEKADRPLSDKQGGAATACLLNKPRDARTEDAYLSCLRPDKARQQYHQVVEVLIDLLPTVAVCFLAQHMQHRQNDHHIKAQPQHGKGHYQQD
eukprot:CAMPEP_0180766792 /NCGR_PEP_ID=MMETSP1038_2-20121128/39679_1 /TAXON_ID=632150 /ORGANISM="Azadinium spinosum, Strain 3D9" /LENGTH=137 /DNA_ID=CAMNT_0022801317 /DNA_START=357 /DNA_END=769 /DNA_ORIENTATION=+